MIMRKVYYTPSFELEILESGNVILDTSAMIDDIERTDVEFVL